jgi:hypothetical protein
MFKEKNHNFIGMLELNETQKIFNEVKIEQNSKGYGSCNIL